jgi:hypothetical protein
MRALKRLLAFVRRPARLARRGRQIEADLLEARRQAETDYQLQGGGPPAHF